jgi:hypothetical protein
MFAPVGGKVECVYYHWRKPDKSRAQGIRVRLQEFKNKIYILSEFIDAVWKHMNKVQKEHPQDLPDCVKHDNICIWEVSRPRSRVGNQMCSSCDCVCTSITNVTSLTWTDLALCVTAASSDSKLIVMCQRQWESEPACMGGPEWHGVLVIILRVSL